MDEVQKPTTIRVRIMNDTKIQNCHWWAEELIGQRWVEIPDSRMSCEGNTRHCVEEYIKKKREEHYRLYVKQVGEDLEFVL